MPRATILLTEKIDTSVSCCSVSSMFILVCVGISCMQARKDQS